jgi:hypothetical protein
MRLVLLKAYQFGTDLHLLLTYFMQAYDMVNKKHLYQTSKVIWDP